MGTKLYVGNLSYNTNEASLREAFGANGREVASVAIIMDRETGRSRGFAFVEMATPEAAQQAMQELDGQDLDGRMLRINEAREREARGPGGGGRWSLVGGGRPRSLPAVAAAATPVAPAAAVAATAAAVAAAATPAAAVAVARPGGAQAAVAATLATLVGRRYNFGPNRPPGGGRKRSGEGGGDRDRDRGGGGDYDKKKKRNDDGGDGW